MNFVNQIEAIVSKSARMLGFIKRISREFNEKCTYRMLCVAFVRPSFEYALCVWSPHQEVLLARIEIIHQNFIIYSLQGLGWTTQPLPSYEIRCLLLGLEVL
jgi:hypothetical protein